MKFAVGKLIGFRNGNDPVHIFETDKVFGGKFCFVADDADNGNFFPGGKMGG